MLTAISGLFKNTRGAKETGTEKVKQTNFERMKKMSVTDMAVAIACVADISRNVTIYGNSSDPVFIEKWLRSEVLE